MQVGDKISFGDYLWRVLDLKDDCALLLTEDIVEQREYHNRKDPVTWADSEMRQYLNGLFLEGFSQEERAQIVPVTNKNDDNHWYLTKGGDDTVDHVFLLSLEEVVCQYFGDSSSCLINRSPKQRYWFQKKDENNPLRRAGFEGYIWWWWLRTPGRDNRRAIYIHGDGNIGIQGNGTFKYSSNTVHPKSESNKGGVRPALWFKIKY